MDVAYLNVVHHSSYVVGCPVADGDVAPTSRVNKGERGKGVRWLTWISVDSDNNLHCHCLDDMAHRHLNMPSHLHDMMSIIVVHLLLIAMSP